MHRPSMVRSAPFWSSCVSHMLGQTPADLVQHVDRAALPLPQLFDQGHALHQLRLLVLELLHLHDRRAQALAFLLCVRQVVSQPRAVFLQRPVPPRHAAAATTRMSVQASVIFWPDASNDDTPRASSGARARPQGG